MSKKIKEIEEGFTKIFNNSFLGKLYEKDAEFLYVNPKKIKVEKQIRTNVNTNSKRFIMLLNSIKEHGILHPLLVKQSSSSDEYILIAGHRRLQAAKTLNLEAVPVRIISDIEESKITEMQFIENVQRENISGVDLIFSISQFYNRQFDTPLASDIGTYIFTPEKLIPEKKHFIEKILNLTGKTPKTLLNMLKVLQLPEEVLEKIRNKRISLSAGYILADLYKKDIRIFTQVAKKTQKWHRITPKRLKELLPQLSEN